MNIMKFGGVKQQPVNLGQMTGNMGELATDVGPSELIEAWCKSSVLTLQNLECP